MNTLGNNLFIGKVLINLDEVNSTNEYAKALLSKSKPSEGTVIFAHCQTNGRGQFGKMWASEKGKNLTFSIILYPDFLEAKRAYSLNHVVSLGLKDCIENLKITVSIKWPNDIYHHDKKLGGLLIENGLVGENLNYSIIGIGLNVNQTTFSQELPNPISLKLISGKEFKIELLNDVFSFIEKRYLQLKSGRLEEIKNEYVDSLYCLNEKRIYQTSNEKFEGIIRGVNDEGQLIMEINGTNRFFNNNEIIQK